LSVVSGQWSVVSGQLLVVQDKDAVSGSATPMRGKAQTCRQLPIFPHGSSTLRSETANFEKSFRQVGDLPRIGVAEPDTK